MPPSELPPVGAVLAGGAGRRIGGDKAAVRLLGRPLVQWVIDAIEQVTSEVAVVAKPETKLPYLGSEIAIWHEPGERQHPLTGVVHALERAQGRAVLAVAADMPLITPAVLELLAVPCPDGSHGRIASLDGRAQPLCGRYEPSALGLLSGFDADVRTTDAVLAIGVEIEEFADPLPFFNVNAPEDLLTAGAELQKRGY